MDTRDPTSLNSDFMHSTKPLHCAFFLLHQIQGKMKISLFLCILCQFYLATSTKIKPKLKKNILNFGYAINYKYEGMLMHSVLEHNLGCTISQHVDAKQLSPPTKWSQQ